MAASPENRLPTVYGDTDTSQVVYPPRLAPQDKRKRNAPPPGEYPMQSYNGGLVSNRNRQAPSSDMDILPHQLRRWVNASGAQDVQVFNGLRWGVGSGKRTPFPGMGFLYAIVPRIPGQQRGDVAGFHKKGPSPLNVQNVWQAGPGSQPSNPGGPGTVASTMIINPMTG